MKFRPCIDIHNGKVKQIVGGSLTDVQEVRILYLSRMHLSMQNYIKRQG